MPTVAERIDPTSPHYDEAFAKLREEAIAAAEAHEADVRARHARRNRR